MRAVVLLSGGLDSATVLALARERGLECYALSVRYGQRHAAELHAAQRVAKALGAARHEIVDVDLSQFGGSALTDPSIDVPEQSERPEKRETCADTDVRASSAAPSAIPVTYVPARNTILLSLALGWAEVLGAEEIHFGANCVDYSGYPDCRPEYVAAFERLAALATKDGVEGRPIRVHAPIITMSKAQIVIEGRRLGVDFSLTVSCYQADDEGRACGRCDACTIRREGFEAAGVQDPTVYRSRESGVAGR